MYMIIHKNTLTTRYSSIFRIIVTRIHIKQHVPTVHMDTYVYFVSRNMLFGIHAHITHIKNTLSYISVHAPNTHDTQRVS